MSEKSETMKPPERPLNPLEALTPVVPGAWMGTAWFENLADFGTEVTTFIADRIKDDVRTQHALMHCKTLAEVQHVQAQFLQKAFDQYHAETGKLVEMTNRMTADLQVGAKADKRN